MKVNDLRRAFSANGFIRVRDAVPPVVLETASSAVERFLRSPLRRASLPGSRLREVAEFMASAREIEQLVMADPIVSVIRRLLGEDIFLHPRWILRVVQRGYGGFASPPHQDFPFTQGAIDTLTCWVPLHDVGSESSPLRFMTGSHATGLRPIDMQQGKPFASLHFLPDEDWISVECSYGDIVIFHSLTVHATAAPRDGLTRVSIDARYQSRADVISPIELTPFFDGDVKHLVKNESDPTVRYLRDGRNLRQRAARAPHDLTIDLRESRFVDSRTSLDGGEEEAPILPAGLTSNNRRDGKR